MGFFGHHSKHDTTHLPPSEVLDDRDIGSMPKVIEPEPVDQREHKTPLIGALKHGIFKALSSTHLRHDKHAHHNGINSDDEDFATVYSVSTPNRSNERNQRFNLDLSQQWNFESGYLVHSNSGQVLTFRSSSLYSKHFEKPSNSLHQDLFPLELADKSAFKDQKWKFERGYLKNEESNLVLTVDPMTESLILTAKDSRPDWKPFQEWAWTTSGHLRNEGTKLVLDSSSQGSLQISLPFPIALQTGNKKSESQQWIWKDEMLINRGSNLVLTASLNPNKGLIEAYAAPSHFYEQQWTLDAGKIVSKLTLHSTVEIVLGVNRGETANARVYAVVHSLQAHGAKLKHQTLNLNLSLNLDGRHHKEINLSLHWRMKKSAILTAINGLALTVKEGEFGNEIWSERPLFRRCSNRRRSANLTDGRFSDEELDSENERHVNHLQSTLSRSSSLESLEDYNDNSLQASSATSALNSAANSQSLGTNSLPVDPLLDEQVKKAIHSILEQRASYVTEGQQVSIETPTLPSMLDIARKIAPRIIFHSEENHMNCSVEVYLQNANLMDGGVELLNKVDGSCLKEYSGLNAASKYKYSGIYLDHPQIGEELKMASPKTYVRVKEMEDFLDFEYWFLFPEHFDYLCPVQPEPEWLVPYLGSRQGVWKRVIVRASKYGNILKVSAEAKNVELSKLNILDFHLNHVKPSPIAESASFPEVTYFEYSKEGNPEGYRVTNNGHPILYCSLKTHCFYTQPGKQGVWHLMDETSEGMSVDYGRVERMEMMDSLPWKAFAGLWGKKGSKSPIFHDSNE